MKKLIRLTEGDLHRIVRESVMKVIQEHDPYDPDYGQYGDVDDAEYYTRDCERKCSQLFCFMPETNQLIPEREGAPDGECYMVNITPNFCGGDDYGFEMDDVDYEIEGDDGQLDQEYGDTINQLINDNIDDIFDYIRKNSPYTIY